MLLPYITNDNSGEITNMSFKIDIDNLLDLTVNQVKERVRDNYKCPLNKLKLFDVLLDEERGTAMRHGVYMFFNDKGECIYIGMCSSSHFAHRLGGHFGMSPKYGMNTFLKRITRKLHPKHNYQSYIDTVREIGEYSYLMIGANDKSKDFIRKLEKQFHIIYLPTLNRLPKSMPCKNKNLAMGSHFNSFLPTN